MVNHSLLLATLCLGSLVPCRALAQVQDSIPENPDLKVDSKLAAKLQPPTTSPCSTCTTKVAGATVHVLTFDMKDRCVAPDLRKLKIKKGDFYSIQVENVDLGFYKVQVEGSDTIASKALTIPAFPLPGLEGLADLIAGIKGSTKAAPILPGAVAPASTKPGKSPPDSAEVMQEMGTRRTALISYLERSVTLKSKISTVIARLELHKALARANATCHQASSAALEASLKDHGLQALVNELDAVRTDIGTLMTDVLKGQQEYAGFAELHVRTLERDSFKESHKFITDAYVAMQVAVDSVNSALNDTKVTTAVLEVSRLGRMGYRSAPILYEGGDATVTLKVEPWDEDDRLEHYVTSFSFPVDRGTYMGVSSSFFVSQLYNDAFSTTATQVNDSTTLYSIVQEDAGEPLEFGFSARFLFGKKLLASDTPFETGLHFSIGPGISVTSTVRPRLLYGFGLSFGREHKLLIDMGWCTGYVERRSAAFRNDDGYSAEPTSITISQLRTDGFISVGYLFDL